MVSENCSQLIHILNLEKNVASMHVSMQSRIIEYYRVCIEIFQATNVYKIEDWDEILACTRGHFNLFTAVRLVRYSCYDIL